MRVIAGKYKGRHLTSPKDRTVRPTSDRVKESVFSILQDRVIDANFLDLCAGTGNIGIEALSRGAKHVTFLDKNRSSIQLIEKNLKTFGINICNPHVQLVHSEVTQGIITLHRESTPFEIVYFDPPYDAELYNKCLSHIANTCILKSSGILIVEHSRRTVLPSDIGKLTCFREKKYGDTCLSFYRFGSCEVFQNM